MRSKCPKSPFDAMVRKYSSLVVSKKRFRHIINPKKVR